MRPSVRLALAASLAPVLAPAAVADPSPALAARTQALYGQRDAAGLRAACAGATGGDDLLCRYRLYPLTQDARLLAGLPASASSAAGHALLAGLIGYEAARAPRLRMMTLGRRLQRHLDTARRLNPNEPLLWLVDGQGLVFRPAIVGGDKPAALALFRRLRAAPGPASSAAEADVWTWYALHRLGSPDAAPMKARLLAAPLPPLYRAFVQTPPGG